MASVEKIKLPDIKFDAQSRRLIERLITRLDVLITLLLQGQTDDTQEQDPDVPSGTPDGD